MHSFPCLYGSYIVTLLSQSEVPLRQGTVSEDTGLESRSRSQKSQNTAEKQANKKTAEMFGFKRKIKRLVD